MDWWIAVILFSVALFFLWLSLLDIPHGLLVGMDANSDLVFINCNSITSQYCFPSKMNSSPVHWIIESFFAAVKVFLRRPSIGCVKTISLGLHNSDDKYGFTSMVI